MARPSVKHEGFLIPNAADVSNPRMAEPDKVDFNTLASPLWGVVEGCAATVSGTSATVTTGTALVNGKLVNVSAALGVDIGSGGTQDRFDLVVVNAGGTVTKVPGIPSADPVFPDPPLDTTVLAAVFVPAGSSSLTDNVIDKRKFVNKALLTKIAAGDDLIRNSAGATNLFLIAGDGRTTWSTDTWIWRSSAETLKVHKHLALEGSFTAEGEIDALGDIESKGNVYGKNLNWSATAPSGPAIGTIWQDTTNGKIWVWRSGAWQELATIQSANPPGTVITSFEVPAEMSKLGWLALRGQEITEVEFPNVFLVEGLKHLRRGTAPNRLMTLPNAQKKMFLTDFNELPGALGIPNPGNLVTLKETNVPRHGHAPKAEPSGGLPTGLTAKTDRKGAHVHKVSGGAHVHKTNEAEHRHEGMDLAGNPVWIIALQWGGANKIDAEFNDRNHTFSVDALT